jgi:phage shock protein A
MYEDLEQEAARVRRALEGLLAEIAEARREMEQAQARLEGLFPLKVMWKGKTCGKRGCRCARGVLHGPYAYLVVHRQGRKLERYLGKGWSPPEGMVSPERYRALMREFVERRERLDRLVERLDRAVSVLRGW